MWVAVFSVVNKELYEEWLIIWVLEQVWINSNNKTVNICWLVEMDQC